MKTQNANCIAVGSRAAITSGWKGWQEAGVGKEWLMGVGVQLLRKNTGYSSVAQLDN